MFVILSSWPFFFIFFFFLAYKIKTSVSARPAAHGRNKQQLSVIKFNRDAAMLMNYLSAKKYGEKNDTRFVLLMRGKCIGESITGRTTSTDFF